MTDGALALALGAGMLAAVNPCGFALLPAYLSLLVLGDDSPGRSQAVRRALLLTAVMTLGFVTVFGVFGLVVSPIAASVQQYLPWFTVVLGVLLAAGGVWLLSGRSLPGLGWRPRGPKVRRGFLPVLAFGASYAVASLACTIAPFLALVVGAFRSDSVVDGVALYLAYALGMGLVVGTVAVAVALARSSLVGRMRRLGRWFPAAAGLLLVAVGGYVAYYGWWEIRVLRGAAAQDPVIDAAGSVQRTISGLVSDIGAVWILVLLVVLVAVAVAASLLRRRPVVPEEARDEPSRRATRVPATRSGSPPGPRR